MIVVVAGVSRSLFRLRCAVTSVSGKSWPPLSAVSALCSCTCVVFAAAFPAAAFSAAYASPAKLMPATAASTAHVRCFLPFIYITLSQNKAPPLQSRKDAWRATQKNPGNFARILAFVQLKKRQAAFPQIPFPSLAGQMAIVNQAVLLAPVHRSPAPSQGIRLSDLGSTDKMKSPGFAQMRRFYRGDKPEA